MPRGRNKRLIDLRNRFLLKRYHYWTEVKRIRFDDALKILSEREFFISEERILAIVHTHYNLLEAMRPPSAPE